MIDKKECRFVGNSRKILRGFPEEVREVVGYAIFEAERGGRASSVKNLKEIGTGVVEIVDNHDGDTYRAVYTVRFELALYVLHAFKKKSKRGIATPKKEIDLIKARLKDAEADYKASFEGK